MRRVVQDYVAASIDRAKPQLERCIARHLKYPEPFPFVFTEPVASILEIRRVKIISRFRADYPPLDIIAIMHISMTARTRKHDLELGTRNFGIDVELNALASVQGDGSEITPQHARLVAWWAANNVMIAQSVGQFGPVANSEGTVAGGLVERPR